jgi:hypothetical protein
MKPKFEEFKQLPEIVDFQGQNMRILKRSRNIVFLTKMAEKDPIDFVFAKIFRMWVETHIRIVNAHESIVLKDPWNNQMAWIYTDFNEAKVEYRRLVKNHR